MLVFAQDFNARLYNPALGVFLAVDPAGQFSNPYLAFSNNPTTFVDPDGEFAWFVPLIIGAVVGSTTGAIRAERNGMEWHQGLWRGALVGVVGGAMSMIGGAGMTFAANLSLGMSHGAITGVIDAALW